jgi:hypothetical protein
MTRTTVITAAAGAAILLAAAARLTLAPLTAARLPVLGGTLGQPTRETRMMYRQLLGQN